MEQKGKWKIIVNEYGMTIDVLLDLNMSLCDSTTAKKDQFDRSWKSNRKTIKKILTKKATTNCFTRPPI